MQDIMHERAWLHTSVDQVPITMRLFYCKVLHTVDKGPIPGAVHATLERELVRLMT